MKEVNCCTASQWMNGIITSVVNRPADFDFGGGMICK